MVTKRILPYMIGGEADCVEIDESLARQRQPVLRRLDKRVVTRQQAQASIYTPDLSNMTLNPTKDWYEEEEITDYRLSEMGVAGSDVVLQFYHHPDVHPQAACAEIWAMAVEDLGALPEGESL